MKRLLLKQHEKLKEYLNLNKRKKWMHYNNYLHDVQYHDCHWMIHRDDDFSLLHRDDVALIAALHFDLHCREILLHKHSE